MRIREAKREDYDDIVSTWEASGLSYRPNGRDSRESISGELAGGHSVFLVAEERGKIVAVAFGTHDGRKGWINRLAVRPELRRQGIARQLVKELEQRFEARGIHIVTCLIEGWNEASQAFFAEIGYIRHEDIVYFSKRGFPDV